MKPAHCAILRQFVPSSVLLLNTWPYAVNYQNDQPYYRQQIPEYVSPVLAYIPKSTNCNSQSRQQHRQGNQPANKRDVYCYSVHNGLEQKEPPELSPLCTPFKVYILLKANFYCLKKCHFHNLIFFGLHAKVHTNHRIFKYHKQNSTHPTHMRQIG